MMPQQYCLRWKYHHSNLQNMFSQLLDRGCFCDVTLACEGQTLKAHRVVLCACSTYFDSILTNCSIEKDPIIIMKDCKFSDVKCLIEFMYKGEINVEHKDLASLLKTAEELRIKGLAEVSWREDDNCESNAASHTLNNNINDNVKGSSNDLKVPNLHTSSMKASPHSMENGSPIPPPLKRKRGRPPLDGEYDSYSTPKIACVESAISYAESSNLVSVMLDDNSSGALVGGGNGSGGGGGGGLGHSNTGSIDSLTGTGNTGRCSNNGNIDGGINRNGGRCIDDDTTLGEVNHSKTEETSWEEPNVQLDYDDELTSTRVVPKIERPDTPPDDYEDGDASTSTFLTPQDLEEWKDVIKMDAYLTTGRRPQFWEEPFTKRVMEAIKTKDLEMKKAASLLGVSYGTLYGRYRETYGCLKHPYRGPLMVSRYRDGSCNNRDVWTIDQGPVEIINILQRGGITTMPRTAELINTSPSSGLLDQLSEWTTPNDRDLS